jgi:hypothetical protein
VRWLAGTQVNAGLTFAIANSLPYVFPELEPKGHDEGASSFRDFFDTSRLVGGCLVL